MLEKIIASIILAFVAIILFVFPITGLYYGYSEGWRKGTIQKYSQKGIINKSYEGEMALEGIKIRSKGGATSVFEFTCKPWRTPAACKALEEAAETGAEVKITYSQWLISPYLFQDSRYDVVDVKILNKEGN